jgi:alanine racemase
LPAKAATLRRPSTKASRFAPAARAPDLCPERPFAGTEGDLVEHGLTPALNHLGQLSPGVRRATFNRPLDAVIHIDTGMHRWASAREARS